MKRWYRLRGWALPILVIAWVLALAPLGAAERSAAASGSDDLQQAFARASEEFGVPQSVLMSVGYNESRWDQHAGHPSTWGGYGIMHLTDVTAAEDAKGEGGVPSSQVPSDPSLHTLDTAAKLLGVDPDVLKSDEDQNVRGGAALLAQYARDTVGSVPSDPAEWYGAVAEYSGSDLRPVALAFADDVYSTIQQGASRMTDTGQVVTLKPRAVTPDKATADPLHLRNVKYTGADCPNGIACRFISAAYEQNTPGDPYDYGNYDLADRPADGLAIRYIVIHDTEGSYASAIATFTNSHSYVSAHYVIRSSDGLVTEMVRPKDVAWQAGNWYINTHSIGIEHEGFAIEGATWYSEQLYHASARLVKYLAALYHVPLDRDHIIGHDNVPGPTAYYQAGMHWDPGPYWDWAHYMALLGAPVNPSGGTPGSRVVVIAPNFATNDPTVTYTNGQGCTRCRLSPRTSCTCTRRRASTPRSRTTRCCGPATARARPWPTTGATRP